MRLVATARVDLWSPWSWFAFSGELLWFDEMLLFSNSLIFRLNCFHNPCTCFNKRFNRRESRAAFAAHLSQFV